MSAEFPLFNDTICSELLPGYQAKYHLCAGDLDGSHKQCSVSNLYNSLIFGKKLYNSLNETKIYCLTMLTFRFKLNLVQSTKKSSIHSIIIFTDITNIYNIYFTMDQIEGAGELFSS